MANIRIKDLANTAASTASDDFLGVDGTTNGTRKLNAYSPSFGGNATVGGTLTVSGGSSILTGAAYSTFYADGSSGGSFAIRKAGVAYAQIYGNETNTVLDTGGSTNLILQTGGATRITMDSTRVSIPLTTASSSTSTGALVVSGGVGVAGALNVGGTLTVNGVTTVSAGVSIGEGTFGAGKIYTSATGGLSLGAKTGSSYDFLLADPSGNLIAYVPTGTTRMVLSSTTASTTTSTGALVVSGGVGVAKEAYVGKTCVVGAGSDNASYVNVYTNDAENTAGPFDITLPSDCVGVVFLNSFQSGVGRSFWEIPFVSFGGTVTLGTSRKTIVTADPVTSAVAAASSKITVSLYAGNTNCYWGIYVNKSY